MDHDLLFAESCPRLDGEQAFCHYEAVRDLLPVAEFSNTGRKASGLLEIADHFDVFVFDAYGVLNVGATAIDGSSDVVTALRQLGKQVFVLSNGASYTTAANVEKFENFGFDFSAKEIFSSRMAAERALATKGKKFMWGVMAKPEYSTDEFEVPNIKLQRDGAGFNEADGFLFLSTLDWDEQQQLMLEESLAQNPRPILVANPDIVSPREDHFGMEPGYIAHRMVRKFGVSAEFHGKPFPSVFELMDEQISSDISSNRICMIGDTLHTDILGGAAHGWHSVLVCNHGMFKGLDEGDYIARSGIVPNWIVPTI